MEFKEKKTFKNKYEEWKFGDWKKGSGKTYVTLETVIPPVPAKLLTKPDEPTFLKKMTDIEDKIKEINASLQAKEDEFKEILDLKRVQVKAGDTGVVVSKELGQKFAKMKQLKAERAVIFDNQQKATENLGQLINDRDYYNSKIDRYFRTVEEVPKGIKQAQKEYQTSSHITTKMERDHIKRIEFLQNSVEFIHKRDEVNQKIDLANTAKKEAGTGLPQLKKEITKLQAEIEELKKTQNDKLECKESFDKQLDKINEKRKKERDEKDRLYKQKDDLRAVYYQALIDYTKQEYLLSDIKWMNEMQGKLKVREEERQRREREYQERKERIRKEKEERERIKEEKKKREEEKRLREIENKRIMEEQLKDTEIKQLEAINADIAGNNLGRNPMYEQIVECEQLKKYCLTKLNKGNQEEEVKEESKEITEQKVKNELEKAIIKGSVQATMSKAEKELANNPFASLKSSKGKKTKKTAGNQNNDSNVDFNLIKKFNNLRISAPIDGADYERTIKDLDELREALIYWGKIVLRKGKIKFITNARKISSIEEYQKQADEEEQYIKNEKLKFTDENTENNTSLNPGKLEIAQMVHMEQIRVSQTSKNWNNDEMSDDSDDEGRGYTAEDMGDEENPLEDGVDQPAGGKKRGPRNARGDVVPDGSYYKKPRQAQRPNAQKFKDIMGNDNAFPVLENADDYDDLEEDGPQGEISSTEENQ